MKNVFKISYIRTVFLFSLLFYSAGLAQHGAWITHSPPIPHNGTWFSDAGDDCLGCVPQNSQHIYFFDINSSQWAEVDLGTSQTFSGIDANGHTVVAYSNELLVGYSAILSRWDTVYYNGTPLTPTQNDIYRSWGSGKNLGYFVTDTHIYVFDAEEAVWKSMSYVLPAGYYGVGFYWTEDDYLGALIYQSPPAYNTVLVYSLVTHSFNQLEGVGGYNHNLSGMTHGFVTQYTNSTYNKLHGYSALNNQFTERITDGFLLYGGTSRAGRDRMLEKTVAAFNYTEVISSSNRRLNMLGYETRSGNWTELSFEFDPAEWSTPVGFSNGGQFALLSQLNSNTQQVKLILYSGITENYITILPPLNGLNWLMIGGTVFSATDNENFYFYSVESGNTQLAPIRWLSPISYDADNFLYMGSYNSSISDSADGYFYNGTTNNLTHLVSWRISQIQGNPYYCTLSTGGPGNHAFFYSGLIDGLANQGFPEGVNTGATVRKNLARISTSNLSCLYEASTNNLFIRNTLLNGSLGNHSILYKTDSHTMEAYSCETGNWPNYPILENILTCTTNDRVGLGHTRDAEWTDIYYAYNSYFDNLVRLDPMGVSQNYGDDVGENTILVLRDSAMYAFDPFAASGTTTSRIFMEYSIHLPIPDLSLIEHSLMVSLPKSLNSNQILTGVEVIIDTVLHSAVGDLEMVLKHNGVVDTLVNHAGGDEDNFINTQLSDAASIYLTNGTAPFTGRYKPYESLSTFSGLDPAGEWTLSIYDAVAGNTGSLEAWGIKLFFDSATEINTGEINNITTYALYQNYPNPFNPSTTINYSLVKSGKVIIKIFDILGREVETIVNSFFEVGNHSTSYIANSELPSGIYFYQLKAGDFIQTKKMIYLK
jgi:hypothetical protein